MALLFGTGGDDDGIMSARTISLTTARVHDLASVRRDLEHLLYSREVWSTSDSLAYDELTELELRFLPCPTARA
jgi:hypothetical protein